MLQVNINLYFLQ